MEQIKQRRSIKDIPLFKYGGYTTGVVLLSALVFLFLGFFLHLSALSHGEIYLYKYTQYTKDFILSFNSWYYVIFDAVSFGFSLTAMVVLALGLAFGIETLMSIGILAYGFSVFFLSFKNILLLLGGSVMVSMCSMGDYFMLIFGCAAIYCLIVALFQMPFVENFKNTYKCLFIGMVVISVFDVWGFIDLLKAGNTYTAWSNFVNIFTMMSMSFVAFRIFKSAGKLIS